MKQWPDELAATVLFLRVGHLYHALSMPFLLAAAPIAPETFSTI